MVFRHWIRVACSLAGLLLAATLVRAADLTGAGASFPFPVYAQWAAQYHRVTGHRVNYQSIGSGGGQQQIMARTVDFGATDDPMSPSDLAQAGLVQFPAVMGGIVPVINVPGLDSGALRLTGPLLADIFLGRVRHWRDPAIVALNPDLALPDADIVVVHRSDGSGTTFVWTDYLSRISPTWREQVGRGKAIRWPTGQGGKGNEGVAAYVRQISGAIGYVEYAYALQDGLAWVKLQNRAGHFVSPTQEAFAAAASSVDWDAVAGMGVSLNHQPGPDAWPIAAASFILLPQVSARPRSTREVLAFFDWAWREGAQAAHRLHYVPLPADVSARVRALWVAQLRDRQDEPLWP